MTPQGHNATIEMIWQYGTIVFLRDLQWPKNK